MRRLGMIAATAVTLTLLAGVAPVQADQRSRMFTLPDASHVPGSHASLARHGDHIATDIRARGLVAGDVVTLWWVIFNDPSECEVGFAGNACGAGDLTNADVHASVLYGGGDIVDRKGRADYDSELRIGDTSGANFGPGLLVPETAEVHVVLRTHGPALDDVVLRGSQLSTFDGGCETSMLPDDHPQRGLPGPNTGCSNIQFAAFAGAATS